MIRLIIVEDEKVIRNGIHKHVPWQSLSIDEVKTAENASEALLICEQFKPDIVISDIRMPAMNGVELGQLFKDRFPNIQIIFISGYSDKEYLMGAISLGAVSYVEKPISVERLSEAITKAVASVKMLRERDKNVIYSLLTPESVNGGKISEILLKTDKGKQMGNDTFFFVMQIIIQKEIREMDRFIEKFRALTETIEKDHNYHMMEKFAEKNRLVLLVSGSDDIRAKDVDFECRLAEELLGLQEPGDKWFVGIGKHVDSMENLQVSYEQSEQVLKCLSYKGWNTFADHRDESVETELILEEHKKNLFYSLIIERKGRECADFLENVFRWLTDEKAALNFSIRNIYYSLNNLVALADRNLHLCKDEKLSGKEGGSFLDRAQMIEEMHLYVLNHVKQVLAVTDEEQKNSYIIKAVTDYIRDNLESRELFIQTLADVVYLSPTYLSSLFKKYTGETINGYITRIRMEKAKELLREPKYKLYHIAEMVGYEDPNYFAKLFKKYTGILPSQYRENKLL